MSNSLIYGACPLDCSDSCGVVVRPGVIASPKGRWQKLGGGRNVNWTTSDALADVTGQSVFHNNRVWIRPATETNYPTVHQPDKAAETSISKKVSISGR